MHRRQFSRLLAGGMAGMAACTPARSLPLTPASGPLIKPARLKKGQTVGLISPASYVSDDGLQKAVKNLESLGLKVKLGKHIRKLRGYNAGTDKERLDDLHAMFSDKKTDLIWCVRGGYGTGRILPQIDYDLIRKHPKILVGYSDITALHLAIYQFSGLITFHAPVGASDFTDYSVEQLWQVLGSPTPAVQSLSEAQSEQATPGYAPYTIRKGTAEGKLLGGNLSLVSALVGTPYLPDLEDALVFLEDVGEKPYRVDRMLVQLFQGTNIAAAAGIALGIFDDCEANPKGAPSLTLKETMMDRFGKLKQAVGYGFSFGHVADQMVLPVGVRARMDTSTYALELLEGAVS